MLTRSLAFVFAFASLAAFTPAFAQIPSKPGDWPQWRGPNRDGISQEKGLLKQWPKDGPKLLWQVDTVGVGYSSLAVKDGRIYTLGDLNGVEHLICLSATDGRTLWAVQPEPAVKQLDERVAQEFQRLDKSGDGQIDDLEALARGWDLVKIDKLAPGTTATPDEISKTRAGKLFDKLDTSKDGRLSFAEAGSTVRDQFARIDVQDKQADAKTLAADRAAILLKDLDKDANGQLSKTEARPSEAERFFGQADKNDPETKKGDELLTLAELTEYFEKSEAGKDGQLTREELATYFVRNYGQGDGLISPSELRGYIGGYRNGMGDGPRGTPTVDGNRVFIEGGNGDLACLDAETGKTIWYVSLTKQFGGGVPGWGYSESPLIEGNLVIVTPGGGKGTLAALDKYTGELVWRSEGTKQGAHYSSPVAADIGGVRQIVQFASSSLFGVAANSGKLLWDYKAANNGTANCCTPVVYQDHVFASSAYGTGGGLAKIVADGDSLKAEEVYFDKTIANHHGGIVLYGNHMYSLGSGPLLCVEYLTGKIVWRKDRDGVGKGSLLIADGMLYLFSEKHEVGLAEATPEAYRETGRFKIASHGRSSWAHPVVAGGRLYLRDQESLAAYDVRAQ